MIMSGGESVDTGHWTLDTPNTRSCIRMMSCVLSLFFLVFLCPAITAVTQTGLKVRLTDKGLLQVKNVGLAFLKKLVNKPFKDFEVEPTKGNKVSIKGLTLTQLSVNPDHVSFTFQEKSGLQLEIKGLSCAVGLTMDNKKYNFDIKNFGATIDVKLKQDQGHLAIEIPKCEAKFEKLTPTTSGIVGSLLTTFSGLIQFIINKMMCSQLQKKTPKINEKLKAFPMTIKPYEGLDISIDFSLSGDITVTSTSLDVPFKASLSGQPVNDALTGNEPVHPNGANMVYVGVSELLFNSAARTLFDTGAMKMTKDVTNIFAKTFLKVLQIFRQPLQLLKPLSGSLEVTEVPVFSIRSEDGLTIRVAAKGQVSSESSAKELVSVSVSPTCSVMLQQGTWGREVTLFSDKVSCKPLTDSSTLVKAGYAVVTKAIESYLSGIKFPLPDGLDLNLTPITYRDGYLTFGGSVNFAPPMEDRLLDAVLQQMSSMFTP